MSNLYRRALGASANANSHPHPQFVRPLAETHEDADGGESEEAECVDQLGSLPSASRRTMSRRKLDSDSGFSPISAQGYFDQATEVAVPASGLNFRVYYSPPKTNAARGTIMVCHHGCGYSGLSFACLAKEIQALSNSEIGVLSFDARLHGKTKPIDGSQSEGNLNIINLKDDAYNLLTRLFPDPDQAPAILLVGHSMGGSVLAHACSMLAKQGYSVVGMVVLDVVEGTALDALKLMPSILECRPEGFDSIEEAIEWHLNSHTIRNPLSARISVPSLLVPNEASAIGMPAFKWRTSLHSTAVYWEGWFLGLSKKFLTVPTARLLILANADTLDKDLLIGQMQGKFQLDIVPDTGHMIHEDNPTKLAEIIVSFWRRNERVLTGFRKVGER